MSKVWFVARYEYSRHVFKRSFLAALISLPLLVALIIGGSFVFGHLGSKEPVTVAYVDESGRFGVPDVGEVDGSLRWLPLPSEQAAKDALTAGQIEAYFRPAADYDQSRRVDLVYSEEPSGAVIASFEDLLRADLLDGQPTAFARRVLLGSSLIVRLPDDGSGTGGREFAGQLNLGHFLPGLAGFALVLLIFLSSGYLLGAVAEEKASRTVEILFTSLSPGRLMAGKILAVLLITLTQAAVWFGLSTALVLAGGRLLDLSWLREFQVEPGPLILALALLIPSYALVAGLMAALGAVQAEGSSGQQAAMFLITLYLMPLAFTTAILRDMNGALALATSFFPLTAPVILPLRAAFGQVPGWQIAGSLALQTLCALTAAWLAGRAFRRGLLGQSRALSLGRLFRRQGTGLTEGSTAASHPGAAGILAESANAAQTGRRAGKTMAIVRYELVNVLSRPLFLLATIGVPLLIFGQIMLFDSTMKFDQDAPSNASGLLSARENTAVLASEATPTGYVDHSGLMGLVPDPIPNGRLEAFPDEAAAERALASGEVAGYYVVPADYLETGELVRIQGSYDPLTAAEIEPEMRWTLLVNLLAGDTVLAAKVWEPLALNALPWQPASSDEVVSEADRLMAMIYPSLVAMLIYGIILMAGGLLLQSVSNEKKNRVMEVLLLSVTPRRLLTGKMIALGLVGLLQAIIWAGMGAAFFRLPGGPLHLPEGMAPSASLVVWSVIFFLLGYMVYASLMAGAGALIPDIKQSPMVSLIFAAPALIGFEIGVFTGPDNPASVVSSIFPLTAPFTMIDRLASGAVPLGQVLLSIGLQLLTIPLIVFLVARAFQAQHLLSGQPFSMRRYLGVLLGRP